MTTRAHAIITASDAACGEFLVEHWLASLRANVDLTNVEVHVLDYGLSPGQRSRLEASGARVHPCRKDGHVANIRYRDAGRLLRAGDYDQVLMVDCGDLVFQADVRRLFDEHKDRFRAVCEEIPFPSRELFDFVNPQNEATRASSAEALAYLEGKPIVNSGVVFGPAARVAALWDEGAELWGDYQVFALDQLVINVILYRSAFVPLDVRYNFVIPAMKTPFAVRGGVFYDARGERIPVVHNAGTWAICRCVRRFGYGADRNRFRPVTRAVLLALSAGVNLVKKLPSPAALLVSGALLGLAFWPGPWGWLAWLALTPLLMSLHRRAPGAAFRRGWLFGTAAWALGMPGLGSTLARTLQAPWPVGFAAFLAISAYSGLMYALLGLAVALLAPPLSRRAGLSLESAELGVALPAFVALEGYFPMMFPNQLANTQYFRLFTVQSADVFGMAGLCWLIVGFNAALAAVLLSRRRGRWAALAAATALIVLNEAYGRRRIPQVDREVSARSAETAPLRVALLQSGAMTRIGEGASAARADFETYGRLARAAAAAGPVDLMLYPENSYGRLLTFARDDAALERPEIEGRAPGLALREDLVARRADSLVGAVAVTRPAGRKYFTAFLADSSDRILGTTAKRDRTPLGEYFPFDDAFAYADRFAPPQLWLLRRGAHRLLTTTGGARLGVYICYESLLEAGAREYSRAGAEILINPSNADQLLPPRMLEQNLRLGAMRAIENRRYVLRPSTLSAVVDPVGRIVRRFPIGQPAYLLFDAPRLEAVTPYARLGPVFYRLGAGLLALLALLAIWPPRRGAEAP